MLDFKLAPPRESILARLPWLKNANSWAMTSRENDHPSVNERGVWPVGNGYVFAHAGLAKPFNRLQGIVGPTYQTEGNHRPEGAFGDCWVELVDCGAAVAFEEQHIWRPRDSGVLVTAAVRSDGVALIVVDCAPPGRAVLVRALEVWGCGDLADPELTARAPHCAPLQGTRWLVGSHRNQNLVIGARHANRELDITIRTGSIGVRLGNADSIGRATVVLAAGYGVTEAVLEADRAGDPESELEQTRRFWSGWLGSTRTPPLWAQECSGPSGSVDAMHDLIETNKVALKMQQSLPGGGVSPMVHFKGVWARDCNGPLRAFLAMGAFAEARALLEYYYRATIHLGRLPNSAALDLPLDGRIPHDWADIPIPLAETPSFIVLQHLWWFEAGGDVELIREHWEYLHRCVTGQTVSSDGRLPFNGDETYLHGALYSIFPERCGWPNDLIGEDGENGYAPWSLESGVLYVSANEAMARMAVALGIERGDLYLARAGRVRSAIERDFWLDDGFYAPAIYPLTGEPHRKPFAPVNLKPLWVAYHHGTDERARSNIDTVVELVGFTGTTPSCGWCVGTTPSLLLHGLLETGSGLAPEALRNLVAMATPAGEWAEVYAPGGTPGGGYSTEAPNRLRPWEGGMALASIYRYFTIRDSTDEPAGKEATPSGRHRTATGPPYPDPKTPAPVVLVTCAADDIERCHALGIGPGEFTVIEIGAPIPVDYFDRVLFDPKDGGRRVDRLVLGDAVTVPSRRSMKTREFWKSGDVHAILERFVAAGGEIVSL